MIVRILGEGQFEVAESDVAGLSELDEQLLAAVEAGDEQQFAEALAALLGRVRDVGRPVPPDHLGPSDLVLPTADASLAEVRELLADEGLIPG